MNGKVISIETERFILREFVAEDWETVLAYQRKPLYLRYYEWTDRGPDDVRDFINMFLTQQNERPRLKFQLAVTLKSTGALIGNCGIRMDVADAVQADIDYELDPAHWGQGYATEAARCVVHFGFTVLTVHRVWSYCLAENRASAHVLEKLGMKREGRLRENEYFKGRWWDTLVYGLLLDEWERK